MRGIAVWAVLLGLMAPAAGQIPLTPEEWPEEPAEVVEFLLAQPYVWGCGNAAMSVGEILAPVYERVSERPDVYAGILAAHAVLPRRLDDVLREARAWRELGDERLERLMRYPAQAGRLGRAARALELSRRLGRENAEPILVRAFDEAWALLRELQPLIDEAVADWHARGGWKTAAAPEDREEVLILNEVRGSFIGVMLRASATAETLESPILVDPILRFWGEGWDDRQHLWARYILKVAGDDEAVVERLELLITAPGTADGVRWHIARELAQHRGENRQDAVNAARKRLREIESNRPSADELR